MISMKIIGACGMQHATGWTIYYVRHRATYRTISHTCRIDESRSARCLLHSGALRYILRISQGKVSAIQTNLINMRQERHQLHNQFCPDGVSSSHKFREEHLPARCSHQEHCSHGQGRPSLGPGLLHRDRLVPKLRGTHPQ
jgi:hypothetical protein